MYHVTTTYVGWLVKRRSGPKEDKVAGDMSREEMHKAHGRVDEQEVHLV